MKLVCGIWLPEDDTHFSKVMNDDGTYQRDTFLTCMDYIRTPKIFYDIGAHVGLWSRMAIKAGFKEINAYEPNPNTFECLERNLIHRDGEYKAHLHNCGIAQYSAFKKLNKNDPSNSGAISLEVWSDPLKSGEVIVDNLNSEDIRIKINEFKIKPYETLVKIDTEGKEADCVLGMDKIIYALRPVVCVEQRSNFDAIKLLVQMGMQIVQQVRRDYILTWKNQ